MTKPATIKNRRDFLAAAQAQKCATGTLILQCRKREDAHPAGTETPRVGYTVTKKVGNSVVRNRVKRRLREAFRRIDPKRIEAGCDYVLIARNKSATCDFSELARDMEFAFSRITANKKPQ